MCRGRCWLWRGLSVLARLTLVGPVSRNGMSPEEFAGRRQIESGTAVPHCFLEMRPFPEHLDALASESSSLFQTAPVEKLSPIFLALTLRFRLGQRLTDQVMALESIIDKHRQ